MDALPHAVFWTDRSGRLLGCNRTFARARGYDTADALLAAAENVDTARCGPGWPEELCALESGETALDREEARTQPDGSVRWVRSTRAPLLDEDGGRVGMIGTEEDVTDRKRADAALRESSNLLDTMLENTPDYVYFKDLDSRFVRYSHRFLELLGLSDPDALKGKSDFDLFTEEHALPAYEDEQRIIATGEPLVAKLEKETHIDGHVGWALTTKLPWRDEHGDIVGTFGISKDVTELKETESRLEQTHHRLVEASRLAGMAEVATDVLHNVGNVLNSINVSSTLMLGQLEASRVDGLARLSELLASQHGNLTAFFAHDPRAEVVPAFLSALSEQLAKERQELVDQLHQLLAHIDHMKQVVEKQQSYARVAGVPEPVGARQLIDDALAINGAALTRHDIEARVEVEELPEILTDKHRALQILVNLVANAKYAIDDAGAAERVVTLRAVHGNGNTVRFEVADTGIGIPRANLTRIFSHGFTTRADGHGFGLHSAALAARDLHGSLVAASDGPGEGAVFTLTLPITPPSTGDAAAGREPSPRQEAQEGRGSAQVAP